VNFVRESRCFLRPIFADFFEIFFLPAVDLSIFCVFVQGGGEDSDALFRCVYNIE
jgi:hypothetical protein